jgi:hypothetical protein
MFIRGIGLFTLSLSDSIYNASVKLQLQVLTSYNMDFTLFMV